jgi:hypothetical protein
LVKLGHCGRRQSPVIADPSARGAISRTTGGQPSATTDLTGFVKLQNTTHRFYGKTIEEKPMIRLLDAKRARLIARAGGVLYLLIIVLGALGEGVVRGSIVVPGNATATAANLRSTEWLWRLGVVGEIVVLTCATALALVLYVLLRRVSRELALMAAFFNLVSIAIEGVAAVSLATALLPLSSAAYLNAFAPEQIHAMTMLSIRTHAVGFGVALIFFGVECVILGYLIHRSEYMPRSIGMLMQIAGICYVINSVALLLSPRLASQLFPTILIPSLIGELSLALWLLVKGVRAEKWDQYVHSHQSATVPAAAAKFDVGAA